MPKQQAKALISDLHERFGDDVVSSQQKALMDQLNAHIHDIGESDPVEPSFLEAVEVFLNDIEEDHPQAAGVVKQLLDTLKNIGI